MFLKDLLEVKKKIYKHPSKHIIVESALKQHWSPTFINVVSTLIFGWKWKLSRRIFIDVVSTLAKQCWNKVDRITLIQRWWTNVISTLKLTPTYVYRRWVFQSWQNNAGTTLKEFRRFNVDDSMLFQRRYLVEKENWVNVCSSALKKQHWNNFVNIYCTDVHW